MNREELRRLIREVVAEATEDLKREVESVSDTDGCLRPVIAEKEQLTMTQGMLTEKQIHNATTNNIDTVRVTRSVLITPLARDAARRKGIAIERID